MERGTRQRILKMNLKLQSDFLDYYDHQFDNSGTVWARMSNNGYCKREQFRILAKAGYNIPPTGTVLELLQSRYDNHPNRDDFAKTTVVAYTDENAHCGDGKELWSRSQADMYSAYMGGEALERQRKKQETFASAYIMRKHMAEPGISFRHLQIGKHVFWIKYTSDKDWRSNCGDGEIKLLCTSLHEGYNRIIKMPLFAIDFVPGKDDRLYAVDLNNAPGIRGTGVERILSPILVVESIKEAVYDLYIKGKVGSPEGCQYYLNK